MQDDFSKSPVSIGEVRADKAGDGSLWSPRDLLVALLRDIDSGKITPDQMVVVFRDNMKDDPKIRWWLSTKNADTTLSMLSRAQHLILKGIYG